MKSNTVQNNNLPAMLFKRLIVTGFAFVMLLSFPAFSQNTILGNAYAHNDYWHKRPLHTALDNGFTYIEADVFLLGKKLIVAHRFPFFKKK